MIVSIIQAQTFLFAFTRIMAILIHVPNLGGSMIPAQVRIGFGIILTAIILPLQTTADITKELGLFGIVLGVGRELIIGTIVGYSIQVVFSILQMAAEIMGMSSGFAAGRVFNPAFEQAVSAFDQMFILVTMLLFLLVDGQHVVLAALKRSFELVPVNSAFPVIQLETVLAYTSQMILTGVQIAMPVLGALILADLALGLLARVAPQVQVFFLGLPLKVGISLLALSISLAVLLPRITAIFHKLGNWMIQILQG